MDDRIRVSDADRDRVAARLRDHFAEGRLTQDELDERLSAALNAKTFGDLRGLMTDLPEPTPVMPRAGQLPPQAAPRPWAVYRHRAPVLPLVLLVLLVAVLAPGGWLLFAFLRFILMFWLVACLAGLFAAGRFHRRLRHDWRSGSTRHGRDAHPDDGAAGAWPGTRRGGPGRWV
jgi:Domain of unknown function (DUF1707)